MFELIYTSLPHGLLPGRSGFTTAAMTAGMPPNLVTPLENLSGYSFTFSEGGVVSEELNPPSCYYIKLRFGNRNLPVAGRVAPYGLDYSKRNNKLAHHLLFESPDELLAFNGGAAELLAMPGNLITEFTGEARTLPFRKIAFPATGLKLLPAAKWQDITGSTDYAALIAGRFREAPQRPFYIKYPSNLLNSELLQLIMEVCALLTPQERITFTFSTYFTSDSAAVECFLRMIPEFSPLLPNLKRFHTADLLELDAPADLSQKHLDSDLCSYAATGQTEQQIIALPETPQATWNGKDSVEFIEDLYDPNSSAIPVNGVISKVRVKKSSSPRNSTAAANGKLRNIFFASAAAIVLFCLISAVCYFTPQKDAAESSRHRRTAPPPRSEVRQSPSQPVTPPKAAAAQPASSAETKLKIPPPPAPPAQAAPAIVPDKPAQAAPTVKKLTLQKMPVKEALKMFISYQKTAAGKDIAGKFYLPERLRSAEKIDISLDRIGSNRIDQSKFMHRISDRRLAVAAAVKGKVPLTPCSGNISDIPHLQITLSDGGATVTLRHIGDTGSAIMPSAANITAFYFKGKNFYYRWNTAFSPEFIALISPGKVTVQPDGKLIYKPSKQEESLQRHIQRSFGNCSDATFRSSSLFLTQWNQAVEKFKTARKNAADGRKKVSAIPIKRPALLTQKRSQQIQEKISRGAAAAALDTVLSNIDKYINSIANSVLPERNAADIESARKFLHKITPLLQNKCEQQADKDKLAVKSEKWYSQLDATTHYRNIHLEAIQQEKTLQECSSTLAAAYKNTISSAGKIHPDVADFLSGQMSSQENIPPLKSPRKISSSQLKSIAAKINKHIKITPATTSVYGGNYE